MRRVALLLLFILPASVHAQEESTNYAQVGQRQATARIKNWVNGYKKSTYYAGTGALVAVNGDRGLVLTAAHLFEGEPGPITVEFCDGQISGARLLAVESHLDVAALVIYAPKGIEPIPLADTNPQIGDLVEIWGYGPKRFRSFMAQVSHPIDLVGDEPNSLVGVQGVHDKEVTIPGDSGGPIVHDGELVGVHWGYRGEESDPRRSVHGVPSGRIRDWLRTKLGSGLRGLLSP